MDVPLYLDPRHDKLSLEGYKEGPLTSSSEHFVLPHRNPLAPSQIPPTNQLHN
jgi:hypothetical protein